MKHVLHISGWHPYITGVSGIFVLEQCKALQDANLRIGLIFTRLEGLSAFSLSRMMRGAPGIVSLHQPVPTIGFKSWWPPRSLALARRFSSHIYNRLYDAYVETHGIPDILHGHVGVEGGLAAQRLSARVGIPYVVTEHSSEVLAGSLTPTDASIAREVYRNARCVIAVSDPLAKKVRELSPEANVCVIGNIVNETVFRMRKRRPTASQILTAVSVCNLVPGKRIENAIEALANLNISERPRYMVIGGGVERRRLENLARRKNVTVQFFGALPHEAAMSVLSEGDLLLHPSIRETFGIVLAEAMALGLPVVTCRSGGPETFVSPDVGILTAPDNVDELTRAIETMLANIDEWREKADYLAAIAHEKFSARSVTRAIIDCYRS